MKKTALLISVLGLAACDSSKPVLVGPDTYMISKEHDDGSFVTESSGEVRIRNQASAFCKSQNKRTHIIDVDKAAMLPATVKPSIAVKFMCLA